ncbi:MAG TPA: ATP-binding protein [Actinomycetota bacterium]|nr:ATP-binding protein [Actinomycetota bacterium]
MATTHERLHAPLVPFLLVLAGVGAVAVYALRSDALRTTEGLASAILAGSALLGMVAVLSRLRYRDAWRSTPWVALALFGLAAVAAIFWFHDVGEPSARPGPYDAAFLLVCFLFLVPAAVEYREHLPTPDRREIVTDVALLSVSLGTALYLFVRPVGAGTPETVSSAVAAIVVASSVGAYVALALWLPTTAHVGQLVAVGALGTGVLLFAERWVEGAYQRGDPTAALPVTLAPLLLAMLVNVLPRHGAPDYIGRPTRYGRAALTTLSVAMACSALALVAWAETTGRLETGHGSVMIGVLAAAVALRILVNQVRGTNATREAEEALDQKEVALRETDRALARLRRANETLRESEERLRTVFESAVDGIVELDHKDIIVRANEAFCGMIDLPQAVVEGQRWSALAASIDADESFGTLPHTGQGTLRREGNPLYVESRTSEVPSDPPRRLLLVRDVTASRVADQTIRSLFKFLQDRDEDRTRIMRRTNAAIESERNRIARDLHDGPVQGVSAASLSLEAVLLMLKAGELEEGIEILAKVRKELSEEADNLRRLMSGLRPPLLEERGLIPALRETLAKYGRDNHIQTEFTGAGNAEIPQDLETLAYRIVQEALSNSGKHAHATRIGLSVEAIGGQLRIEVTDNGVGFDSAKAREYLQMGRVGLASMRERVELANGTFMVHSTPGRGTTVMASLPLDAVPAPREFSVSEA